MAGTAAEDCRAAQTSAASPREAGSEEDEAGGESGRGVHAARPARRRKRRRRGVGLSGYVMGCSAPLDSAFDNGAHPSGEPMTPSLSLSQIGQISIIVHDLERAVAFYRDTLGMKFLFQVAPKMAFFDCGGVRLYLGLPEEEEFDHPGSILYYKVDDIKAAWEALRERGAEL